MECCSKLQRLFLSYNEIQSLVDINNLSLVVSLQEMTLDNNPISGQKNYKRNVVGQLSSLRVLDFQRLSDEEKRVAEKSFLKEELKKRDLENKASIEVIKI